MSNDVIIRVRVRQDTRDGFAAVGKEAEASAQNSADKFTAKFGSMFDRMGQIVAEPIKRAGATMGNQLGESTTQTFVKKLATGVNNNTAQLNVIGKTIGERIGDQTAQQITTTVTQRLRDSRGRFIGGSSSSSASGGAGGSGGSGGPARDSRGRFVGRGGDGGDARVSVDVDRQGFLAKMAQLGRDAASKISESLSSGLSSFFSGDIVSLIVKSLAVATLAPAIAIPLGAAITSGVLLALGGGVIALGVAAAFKDPRIMAGAKELGEKLKKSFATFGENFRTPVAEFLEKFNTYFLPQLEKFGERIGKIFGPLTSKLGDGIIGFLQKALPGIEKGLEGAAPIIEVFAERLPELGKAVGDFFAKLGSEGENAAVFFNDLITLIIKLIDWTGTAIAALTSMYVTFRKAAGFVKKAVSDLFDWIWERVKSVTDSITATFASLSGRVGGALNAVRARAVAAFNGIRNAARAAINAAIAVFNSLRARAGAILNALLARARAVWNGMVSAARGAVGRIIGAFTGVWNSIVGGINRVRGAFSGLADWAASQFSRVVGAAQSAASTIGSLSIGGLIGGLFASGGVVGGLPASIGQAASGGIRNGLTMVGERGPELINVAPGSKVWSHGDSMRMLAGAGGQGGGVLQVHWVGSESALVRELMNSIQFRVVREFSGSVQSAMGR